MKVKVLLLIFVFLVVLTGCEQENVVSDSNEISQNNSGDNSTVESVDSTSIYDQFIKGEITAKGGDNTDLYVNQFEYLNEGFKYTIFDVDGDNTDELCIKNYNIYIFKVKNNELYNLYTDTRSGSTILNDGGFFQILYGDAPEHIYYDYRKINEDGCIETQIYFSWWDAHTLDSVIYPESYFIDDKEVTKEKYEEFTDQYLNIGEDKVTWINVAPIAEKISLQNTQSENKDIYTELENTINIPYQKALDDAESTADIREVHTIYSKKWKEVSTEYYNKLIKIEELEPYIIKLKTDWDIYYNSQLDSYRNIYGTIFEGGSITGIVFDSRERELQKEWALQLVNIYEHL